MRFASFPVLLACMLASSSTGSYSLRSLSLDAPAPDRTPHLPAQFSPYVHKAGEERVKLRADMDKLLKHEGEVGDMLAAVEGAKESKALPPAIAKPLGAAGTTEADKERALHTGVFDKLEAVVTTKNGNVVSHQKNVDSLAAVQAAAVAAVATAQKDQREHTAASVAAASAAVDAGGRMKKAGGEMDEFSALADFSKKAATSAEAARDAAKKGQEAMQVKLDEWNAEEKAKHILYDDYVEKAKIKKTQKNAHQDTYKQLKDKADTLWKGVVKNREDADDQTMKAKKAQIGEEDARAAHGVAKKENDRAKAAIAAALLVKANGEAMVKKGQGIVKEATDALTKENARKDKSAADMKAQALVTTEQNTKKLGHNGKASGHKKVALGKQVEHKVTMEELTKERKEINFLAAEYVRLMRLAAVAWEGVEAAQRALEDHKVKHDEFKQKKNAAEQERVTREVTAKKNEARAAESAVVLDAATKEQAKQGAASLKSQGKADEAGAEAQKKEVEVQEATKKIMETQDKLTKEMQSLHKDADALNTLRRKSETDYEQKARETSKAAAADVEATTAKKRATENAAVGSHRAAEQARINKFLFF